MNFIFDDYAEDMDDFDSEAIEVIAYNRDEALLYIEFQSGGEYIYSDVAESTYDMFKNSPSLGTFYRQFIAGKYTSERAYDTNLLPRADTEGEAEVTAAELPVHVINAETQEAPTADWDELLGHGAVEAEDFGLSVPPSGLVASRVRAVSRFGVKFQIAGTGIIAESEIEALDSAEALGEFYETFASELPWQTANVIALTQYF